MTIVRVTANDGIAVVTMDFPERRNAFSLAMRQGLVDAFDALASDPQCRAIVLTGAGNTFCAGGDITEMRASTALETRGRLELIARLVRLMVAGPKPVIAAVEGHAAGAGLSLAAACDFVVASSSARFRCAFARLGLLADTGATWTLPNKVGAGKARELIMLAEEFDGAQAQHYGLVNRVVESGRALPVALEVARQFAQMPPTAMALSKAALATGLDEALRTEIDLVPVGRQSADHAEAVAAFLGKRKPDFRGS